MVTRLLLSLLCAMLHGVAGELNGDKVQQFNFRSASHYRKEYKDRDGTVYGEYGLHMPDGWTRVLKYETTGDKVQRLIQEYRVPTGETTVNGRGVDLPKSTKSATRQEELDTERGPAIQIIAVPQLWKVRGQDLLPSASELQPVTLLGADQPPTLAPPALTQQRALYNFGYVAPYHGHNETTTESGAKFGEYYVDLPNCWRSVVRYYADEDGYHPTLRRVRTPGCLQQKREVTPASVPAAADQPAGGPLPGEPDVRVTPAVGRQQEERRDGPRPAKSDQARRVSDAGRPSASSGSSPAACLDRDTKQASSRPYGFAYNAGTHYHWERGFANGTKVGAYAVQLPDGTLRTTSYTADCTGFRPSITVEPIDQAKFRRDFEAFDPPKEAQLFGAGELPQASAIVRSEPAPAPQNSVRTTSTAPGAARSSQVRGQPPNLVTSKRLKKTTSAASTAPSPTASSQAATSTTQSPTTTAGSTSRSTIASTTAAPRSATPTTSTSSLSPTGGRRIALQLAPIVPLRPPGSGPYHFYVHLTYNYHEERAYKNGTVAGQYGVVAPDGVLREVSYTSSEGFVPTLTDTQVGTEHDLSNRPSML